MIILGERLYGDGHLADRNDPNQYGYYRDRHICLEKKKAHVVLVRDYS